jgi:hypothetical protein
MIQRIVKITCLHVKNFEREITMKNVCLIALILAACACFAQPTQANVITMGLDLNYTFSGTNPESAVSPWLTAQFADGPSGSVVVTLIATNLTNNEFVGGLKQNGNANDGWYLNLDPNLNPSLLSFSSPVKTGAFNDPAISAGANTYKADGDGYYDILVSFPEWDGLSTRFTAGDSYQFTVTSSQVPLTVDSFACKSILSATGYYTAAHVQSIGSGSNSGWIAATSVPEPATFVLAALGIAGMGLLYQRRSKI